jgi:hypothetical protein
MTAVVGLTAAVTAVMGLIPQFFDWAVQASRF